MKSSDGLRTSMGPMYFNAYIYYNHDEVKYLGVIFDNNLKFEKQINNTTMKINRMVGILWRCRDLPIETKLTIYHSAPYLLASQLWNSYLGLSLSQELGWEISA